MRTTRGLPSADPEANATPDVHSRCSIPNALALLALLLELALALDRPVTAHETFCGESHALLEPLLAPLLEALSPGGGLEELVGEVGQLEPGGYGLYDTVSE